MELIWTVCLVQGRAMTRWSNLFKRLYNLLYTDEKCVKIKSKELSSYVKNPSTINQKQGFPFPLFRWLGQVPNSAYATGQWHCHFCCWHPNHLALLSDLSCVWHFWLHHCWEQLHIWHKYWHTSAINAHWVSWTYDTYVVFEGYICCWHKYGYSMEK